MKNSFLINICLFIGVFQVHSYEYFLRDYDYNFYHDFFYSVVELNDGYLTVGSSYSNNPSNWISIGLIMKIDSNGNGLKTHEAHYSENTRELFYSVKKNESLIYAVGSIYIQDKEGDDGVLVRLNENGEIVWHKTFNQSYDDRIHDLIVKDTFLLLVGYEYIQSTGHVSKMSLTKTDTSGNIIWKKKFGMESRVNFGYSIIETSDGGYLISGEGNHIGQYTWNMKLIKLNADFEVEWSNPYGRSIANDRISLFDGVVEGDDGYFYLTGETDYQVHGTYNRQGILIKIDAEGNQVWEKFYNRGQYRDVFHGIHKLNGNLILHGTTRYYAHPEARPMAWLLSVDTAGDVLWERNFYQYSYLVDCYVLGKTITDNGDILITGYVFSEPYFTGTDAWLIKTDSCGYSERDTTLAYFTATQGSGISVNLENLSETVCSQIWDMGDGTVYYHPVTSHTYSDTGTYTITLTTRAANTTDTYTTTISVGDSITVIREIAEESTLSIYPNPVSEKLFIKGKLINDSFIEIYDVQGRSVFNQIVRVGDKTQPSVDVSELITGLYYVIVRNQEGEKLFNDKIVIVR